VICLLKRDALEAIDPVTGRTLWTRSDVNSRTQVFGDDHNIYVVGIDDAGSAVGSRVFRAYDGVSVNVRDFAGTYDKRVRMLGRNILASGENAKGELEVRIYDVLAGKDLWKQTYPAGSVLTKSEDRRLVGVVESNGDVHILDLPSQKEVMTGKLWKDKEDVKPIDKAQAIYLVADRDNVYLGVNGAQDPNIVPWSGVQSNLLPGTGLRSVPVNGELYCFRRDTGERRWIVTVRNQMLVTSRFEDLPIVLFTSRFMEWVGGPAVRNQVNVSYCQAFDKRSGKWIYDNKTVPPGMYFHDLSIDTRAGKVDLTGYQMKVTFTVTQVDK